MKENETNITILKIAIIDDKGVTKVLEEDMIKEGTIIEINFLVRLS